MLGRLGAAALRFGAVGVGCTALNAGIVWAGTEWLRWPYLAAAAVTCLITIPLSFMAHRQLTFQLRGAARWREFGRYLLQQLSQFALGLTLMAALVEGGGLHPALAMVAASGLMFLYGFATNAGWVFRGWHRS